MSVCLTIIVFVPVGNNGITVSNSASVVYLWAYFLSVLVYIYHDNYRWNPQRWLLLMDPRL